MHTLRLKVPWVPLDSGVRKGGGGLNHPLQKKLGGRTRTLTLPITQQQLLIIVFLLQVMHQCNHQSFCNTSAEELEFITIGILSKVRPVHSKVFLNYELISCLFLCF